MSSHNRSYRGNARPSGSGRRCTKVQCSEIAVRTLTYIYSDSTAVLGPLSSFPEPHSFDLCQSHSKRLTVPQGWTSVVHEPSGSDPEPTADDLMAIADAVREAGKSAPQSIPHSPEVGRRGHLRVIPSHNPLGQNPLSRD